MAEQPASRIPIIARLRRRRLYMVLAVGGAVVLSTCGAALALWLASGSGDGGASALSAQSIAVAAAPSPTADLFPGASGVLQFELGNPNPYPVTLDTVAYGTITSSDEVNCPSTYLTTAADGTLVAPIALTANASATPATIADAITLDTNAPDGCQGVTFTVAVTLSGSQV